MPLKRSSNSKQTLTGNARNSAVGKLPGGILYVRFAEDCEKMADKRMEAENPAGSPGIGQGSFPGKLMLLILVAGATWIWVACGVIQRAQSRRCPCTLSAKSYEIRLWR